MAELDIVIPVYNEKENIVRVLDAFKAHVKTPYRVFICYDMDEDTTLEALDAYDTEGMEIERVKNPSQGGNQAVKAGLAASTAPIVSTHMADDDFNAHLIDRMVASIRDGNDIVTGSRFVEGGSMERCRLHKYVLTRSASWIIHNLCGVASHDATTGFRMFSRRVIDSIEIESTEGFTYSVEMLVKSVRLGWRTAEVPAIWEERDAGGSRFRVFRWILPYMTWLFYAFATRWLGRGPETVRLRPGVALDAIAERFIPEKDD